MENIESSLTDVIDDLDGVINTLVDMRACIEMIDAIHFGHVLKTLTRVVHQVHGIEQGWTEGTENRVD